MIVEQNGLAFAMTRAGLLEFLDDAAAGRPGSLDGYGGHEVGSTAGDVTGISPSKAALFAKAIRAGMVEGLDTQPVDDHEVFAAAVNWACMEEAMIVEHEDSQAAA